MRTCRLFAAALISIAPATLAAQALPSASTVARVADSLARDFVASGGAPSVAIGVVRGSDTIAMLAVGRADLENDIAATAHSVYRIGSVTKQFTAAAIMQLVEQKKVALADSIASYVTGLPAAWRGVTISQLLNHTSGIPSYTGLGDPWKKVWGVEMTPDTIIALTFSKPMDFAPGGGWSYDNTGYILLGMVIEKVTGKSWGDDLQTRFATPLGLSDTRECLGAPLIARRAHGYEKKGLGWENTFYLAMSQPYAAGAVCSTVVDMAKWNRALHAGRVVSAASYAMMTTPEGAATKGPMKYGFGLMRDTLAGRAMVSHGGGIHGFTSANIWVPDVQLSITVLANSGSARSGDLMQQLARAALGTPLVQPPRAILLAAADRSRYVGVYALELPNGIRDFTVALADSGVTGQLVGQGANPMMYLGDHTFGVSFDKALRITFTIDGDRATKLTLHQGGGVFEAKRKSR